MTLKLKNVVEIVALHALAARGGSPSDIAEGAKRLTAEWVKLNPEIAEEGA